MTVVRSRGSDRLLIRQRMESLDAAVVRATQKALVACGARIQAGAQTLVRQPGQGRVYTHHMFTDSQGRVRPGKPRSVPHQASAPGEPPASDTGRLLGSIQSAPVGDGLRVEVTATTEYARYLEFGTTKMAARPYMSPALQENKEACLRILVREMFRAILGRVQ